MLFLRYLENSVIAAFIALV